MDLDFLLVVHNTLKAMPGMQVLQKAAIMLTQKNGTQQRRKVPIITPTVMAAL